MIGLLRSFVRFIRYRDSMSAMVLMIDLGEYLAERDARDMGDYFNALADNIARRK